MTTRQRAPRATREERDRRIQQCRALLARGQTKSDIKRLFKKSYGLANTTTEGYVAYARKRNMETLDKTADQHLADSIQDWADMRRQADEQIVAACARITTTDQRLQSADAVLSSENATDDALDRALEEKRICHAILDAARREVYSARQTIMSVRRDVDRLLGNHAPVKHAETTKDGRDIRKSIDDGEPITAEQEEAEILEMYETLKTREQSVLSIGVNGNGNGNRNGNGKAISN